jgi:hypothetical protein
VSTAVLIVYQEAGDPREYTFTARDFTLNVEGRTAGWWFRDCGRENPYGTFVTVLGELRRGPLVATTIDTNFLNLGLNGTPTWDPLGNVSFGLYFAGDTVPAVHFCPDGLPLFTQKYPKPLAGNHLVEGCSFSTVFHDAIAAWNLSKAQLTIRNNEFSDVGEWFSTPHLDDTDVVIENNSGRGYAIDIWVQQASLAVNGFLLPNSCDPALGDPPDCPLLPFPAPSTVTVRGNRLGTLVYPLAGVTFADAVVISDYSRMVPGGGDDGRVTFEASNNVLQLDNTAFAGITTVAVRGVSITDNIIAGAGFDAIASFGSADGLVRGNDLSGFTPLNSCVFDGNCGGHVGTGLRPTPIILGPRSQEAGYFPYEYSPIVRSTENFTVYACPRDVLDLGTGDTVTGTCPRDAH